MSITRRLAANVFIAAGLAINLCLLSRPALAQAYSLTVLHYFSDGSVANDGREPEGPVILANDGNFYGTTSQGGTTTNPNSAGSGTVFQMTPSGAVTILHSFMDGSVTNDGESPNGALVQGLDGNLYGTTFRGGAFNGGTVFKITLAGVVTILHSFGNGTDGTDALGTLVQASDGTFFGTTRGGGTVGGGTVFSITPTGTYAKLHDFDGSNDGNTPNKELTDGHDGFYYGTALVGSPSGHGTIFKVTPSGTFTVVHSMSAAEGNPGSGLVLGNDGNLYGTGKNNVFKVSTSGTLAIVHTFTGIAPDGDRPASTLVKDSSGTLYGAFQDDAVNNYGGVYSIDSSGTFNRVYTYVHFQFGAAPLTSLMVTPSGDIYGTSVSAAAYPGTVFKLHNSGSGGPTTHFFVLADPLPTGGWQAGVPFNVDVSARDAIDNIASGYTGTVHFTSDDPKAVLPADSSLVNDHGTFSVTMYTAGSITATDTVTSTITGNGPVPVDPIALVIGVPHSVTAGAPFNFTVTALDTMQNSIATLYTEALAFGSNAPRSTLPATSALANGTGNFSATLTHTGTTSANFKLHAANANGAVSGTSPTIVVIPAAAAAFAVSIPSVIQSGVPFNVSVVAKDAYGNTATGYSGAVHFSSSDGTAVLPANSTLTSGAGLFTVTLKTAGSQSLAVTDTVSAGIHGTSNTSTVLGAIQLRLTAPAHVTAGTPFNFTVLALDRYYRVVPGYSGTITFYSNAHGATLPANSTLTNGSGTFSATLPLSGSFKISGSDTLNVSIRGTTAAIMAGP